MNEPEYVFVKGKGWIAQTINCIRATTRDGHNAWVYERLPERGEKYVCVDRVWRYPDGSVNLHFLVKHIAHYEYKQWHRTDFEDWDPDFDDGAVTVVFDCE